MGVTCAVFQKQTTMSHITLRPATAADLPAILEIVNNIILTSTANYHYEPETLSEREAWLIAKQQHDWPVIAAVDNGACVGFGTYGPFREKTGYRFTVEHSVYVAESHRGRGVGKLLLTELIHLAKAQNMHTMIAGVDNENQDSIDFHEKFGFEKVAHFREIGYKFDRWLDVVFLQLML